LVGAYTIRARVIIGYGRYWRGLNDVCAEVMRLFVSLSIWMWACLWGMGLARRTDGLTDGANQMAYIN
jgi:hypothetical protein